MVATAERAYHLKTRKGTLSSPPHHHHSNLLYTVPGNFSSFGYGRQTPSTHKIHMERKLGVNEHPTFLSVIRIHQEKKKTVMKQNKILTKQSAINLFKI